MTETDISKVLIEGDYATIMGVKYKRVEELKTPVEEAYKEVFGKYPETGSDATKFDIQSWNIFRYGWNAAKEDGVVDEPEYYDEVEWDEKDNPNLQKIIDEMVEERKSRKLWNILKDKWGFSEDACGDIVEAVAEWLPKEHDTNSYKWNECLKLMREKLR
jgi:hypothetical protein